MIPVDGVSGVKTILSPADKLKDRTAVKFTIVAFDVLISCVIIEVDVKLVIYISSINKLIVRFY